MTKNQPFTDLSVRLPEPATSPFTDLTVHLPEWLTTSDLAALVRAPESTVRYWRHLGRGPKGTRVGRRVLYRRSDVDRWLAQREQAEHGLSA